LRRRFRTVEQSLDRTSPSFRERPQMLVNTGKSNVWLANCCFAYVHCSEHLEHSRCRAGHQVSERIESSDITSSWTDNFFCIFVTALAMFFCCFSGLALGSIVLLAIPRHSIVIQFAMRLHLCHPGTDHYTRRGRRFRTSHCFELRPIHPQRPASRTCPD
jgi:hypothetical protein